MCAHAPSVAAHVFPAAFATKLEVTSIAVTSSIHRLAKRHKIKKNARQGLSEP